MRKVLEVIVVVAFLGLVGFALAAKTHVPVRPARNLKVAVADLTTIESATTYPGFVEFPDGHLLVGDRSSRDGGRTWADDSPLPIDGRGGSAERLSDGTVLVLGGATERVGHGRFRGARWVSIDNGATWKGPLETTYAIPKAAAAMDGARQAQTGPRVHRSIVEMPDGDLLASVYGHFEGDTTAAPGYPNDEHIHKYRTFVVKSDDGGASWRYLSTVAYDPRVGREGFCEPTLQLVADDELLCVMRTGATLYQCRSTNWGKTWAAPEPLAVSGVDPQLRLLDSGVLACAYGGPGNNVIFDPTGTGRAWGAPVTVSGGQSTGYGSVEEIAPGVLLYVHDAADVVDQDGGSPETWVRGAFITVERK